MHCSVVVPAFGCRAAETICALQVYYIDHGEYPESLDALVPDYMPEVPIDPFTGDPMVYRQEGEPYTLYSLGADMEDDGGVRDRDDYWEGDVVFVPLRER